MVHKTLTMNLRQLTFCFTIAALSLLLSCGEDGDDNSAPVIKDQNFSIAEDAEVGTLIGTVVASDPDDDELSFSVDLGNQEERFGINSNTGAISNLVQLDYETGNTYAITVKVSDGDKISSAVVTINVEDVVDEITPSPLSEYVAILTAMTWSPTSVQTDGGVADGNWDGMQITFSGTDTDGTFTTTNVPSGFEDVWPSSGTWEFDGDPDTIIRFDGVVMSAAISEEELVLEFNINTSGRVSGIDGYWTFVFN